MAADEMVGMALVDEAAQHLERRPSLEGMDVISQPVISAQEAELAGQTTAVAP